jgi:hypothetical protein
MFYNSNVNPLFVLFVRPEVSMNLHLPRILGNVAKCVLALLLISSFLIYAPSSVQAAVTCSSYHTVKAGESLAKIASLYDVSATELAAANGITDGVTSVGSSICIPGIPIPTTIHWTASVKYHKTVSYSGYGFPKAHAYLLKVRKAGVVGGWYKIRNVKPTSAGKISGTFTLPEALRCVSRVQVCLKEVNRGYIVCYTANVK